MFRSLTLSPISGIRDQNAFSANPLDKYNLHHRRKSRRYQQQKTSKCQASDLKFN